MKCGILVFLLLIASPGFGFSQTGEMRSLCREATGLEAAMAKLNASLQDISKKEKMSMPAVTNVYEILSRYCTILANIQRFSDILVINKYENKNDFVRCSIIIKSFSDYFRAVSTKLKRDSSELKKLQKKKQQTLDEYRKLRDKYAKVCAEIDRVSKELADSRVENVIQNDVVLHIAAKSNSIDELDAELEAENIVGVLRNSKISTRLVLAYPAHGRIIAEFGDRGEDDEMVYYLGLETSRGAIVTAPAKGQVVFAGNFLNYKNMVIISNGEYRVFLYGMKNIFVSTGDVLEIGDYIGKMEEDSKELPVVKIELRRSGEPLDPRHWLLQSIEEFMLGNGKELKK